ncbi:MAG: hypothetical protein RLZZ460_489, partial [Chloroflexota bacterium]
AHSQPQLQPHWAAAVVVVLRWARVVARLEAALMRQQALSHRHSAFR